MISFFTRRKFVDLPFVVLLFYLPLVLLHFLLCSVFKVHPEQLLSFEPSGSWWAQVRVTLRFSAYVLLSLSPQSLAAPGGLKWIRTTDLTLIRRAL